MGRNDRKGKSNVSRREEREVTAMTTEEMVMYDMIVDMGIATADELNLARNLVDGSWEEVMNRIVYARTGYHSLDQMMEEEDEEEWVEGEESEEE